MGAWDRASEAGDVEAEPHVVAAPWTGPRGPEPRVGERTDRESADQLRVLADGSWEWREKGLRLGPADNATADRALAERLEAEGRDPDGTYGEQGITPALRRVEASLDEGGLVGCPELTLKEPDRFKEKLARQLVDFPDRPTAELAADIHDGIRYTFAFDTTSYTAATRQTVERLQGEGYQLLFLRNSWDSEEYKGINSRWLDPDSDSRFEVQFHTPESWAAKQDTHDAYETIDSQGTPEDERQRLRAAQAERSAMIPVPPGVSEIQDFRRKDR